MVPLTFPYTIKITGRAGEGVICTGDMLLYALSHYGFYGSAFREYPSNIQGGYSAVTIQISETVTSIPAGKIDCLFIRFLSAVEMEIHACCKNAVLIFDSSQCSEIELHSLLEKMDRSDIQLLATPLKLSENDLSSQRFFSSEMLGVIGRFLSIPIEALLCAVQNRFGKKDSLKLQKNLQMVSWGYQIPQNLPGITIPLSCKKKIDFLIMDGNEAIARGAVAAGCGFFASYPITPSTGIGNILSMILPGKGGVSYQAEDEIAAIGAAIGASFAGVKSMVATSGPGLSLMQEFLGYASMIELPLVIIDVQRPGPSTGSPAKFAQEDLLASVFGSHGESSHIVVAPGTIEDCYPLTIEAFNCSEYYQCPVIVLSDSALGLTKGIFQAPDVKNVRIINRCTRPGNVKKDAHVSEDTFDERKDLVCGEDADIADFKRYSLDSATASIPVPGNSSVTYRVTGLEHDEYGKPTDCAEMRALQYKRRMKKIDSIENMFPSLVEWDCITDDVDCGLVAWGATAIIAKNVVGRLRSDGFRVAAVYPRLLFPICINAIERLRSMASLIIIPESNGCGQYAKLLRMYTGVKAYSILSHTGSPILSDKLYNDCVSILNRGR